MERLLLDQMALDRVEDRRRQAADERLVRSSHDTHGTHDELVAGGGRVWAWRRAVGFRLVRLGLRTALGASR